jgi:hypothetical protein
MCSGWVKSKYSNMSSTLSGACNVMLESRDKKKISGWEKSKFANMSFGGVVSNGW